MSPSPESSSGGATKVDKIVVTQAEPVQQRSKLSGEEKEGATKIDDKDKKGDSANDQQGCSTRTKAGEKPAIHSPAYGSWTGDGGNKKGSSSIGKLAWQMAQHSSLHGIGWYATGANRCFRLAALALSVLLMFFTPIFIGYELRVYLDDETVHQNLHTYRAESIAYPNITICNPRFFKKDYLQVHSVSDELANYLLLALDTTIHKHVQLMNMSFPGGSHIRRLESLEDELQATLKRNGLNNLLELYYLLADKCEDFIMFCEEHRSFYMASDSNGKFARYPSCCDTFFHSKPFFTPAGTCFTTKTTVTETTPATESNIRIWTTFQEKSFPELDMVLIGTDAAERHGIIWTLSYEDHPAKNLFTKPRKLAMGTSTLVGLQKRRVDRSHLSEPCLEDDQDFTTQFGIHKTQLNCLLVQTHYTVPNCSMAMYFGLKQVNGLPPCLPSDHILYEGDSNINYSNCLYDCNHVYYDMVVSTSTFDKKLMGNFLDSGIFTDRYNTSEVAILQFYFRSFDYEEAIIFEEGFDIFLSRVGGWIGLAQGGSVISAVEIICFFSILTFAATREAVRERWWRRWQRRRSKLSRQVLDRRTKLGKKLKTFSPGKVTT